MAPVGFSRRAATETQYATLHNKVYQTSNDISWGSGGSAFPAMLNLQVWHRRTKDGGGKDNQKARRAGVKMKNTTTPILQLS
jgi:hypothetical protein